MVRGARFLFFAVAMGAALAPWAHAQAPGPASIPPGTRVPLQDAAFHALETLLRRDTVYLQAPGASPSSFVSDQMLGVLAALNAARMQPDQAQRWKARALDLWSASEGSYDAGRGFYHKTIPRPDQSTCIDLDTHGWALKALVALQANGVVGAPAGTPRLGALQLTIDDLLEGAVHSSLPACNLQAGKLNPYSVPVAVWGLLDARQASPDARGDGILRGRLNALASEFRNGAFPTSADFYDVSLNARLLIVFSRAATVFSDAALASRAAGLIDFLEDNATIRAGTVATARHVSLSGSQLKPTGGTSPLNQLWAAFALYNAGNLTGPRWDLVGQLLEGMQSEFWSPAAGAYLGEGGIAAFDANALAAFLTQSPVVSGLSLDAPNLAMIVPSDLETHYSASDARLLGRAWTARFTLTAEPTSNPTTVMLALQSIAGFNLSASPSPEIHLFRLAPQGGGRTEIPLASIVRGTTDLVRFNEDLGPSGVAHRLDAFPPVSPTSATWGKESVRVGLRNDGTASIALRPLRLEFAATDVTIGPVLLNDQPLPMPEVVGPITTEELPQPHLRLIFNDASLLPGENELLVGYRDSAQPVVAEFRLFRDAGGLHPLDDGEKASVVAGEPVFARARVTDNGALRSVYLSYAAGGNQASALPMNETTPDVFFLELPSGGSASSAKVAIVAIDAAGNLNEPSKEYTVTFENPLFSGRIVLLVFAATLCATTFFIWMKLRRKGRAP